MKIKIKRQVFRDTDSYWQTFNYTSDKPTTVAGILDELNYNDDLEDENGVSVPRIRWECSCMQKMCGACAMIINGTPSLACCTFIDPSKKDILTLEPLSKFPVISDLIVDRTCILEYAKQAELYLSQASVNTKESVNQYKAAKCIKCGLCLEICPNYNGPDSNFFGAVFANESYLLSSMSNDRKKDIKKEYRKHFENGCSKSLACRDICPMKIPTLSSISYMNR